MQVDVECDEGRMVHLTKQLKRQVSCLSLNEYDRGEDFPPDPHPLISRSDESFGKLLS